MRIGIVAPPWLPIPPPAYGGTESVVDRLARGLAARGHEVVLAASGDSRCAVPLRSPFESAQTTDMGLTVTELFHTIEAHAGLADVDVVHDHTLTGAFVAPEDGPPLVVTNHGPFDPALGRIFAAIAERAAVVAISAGQARRAGPGVVASVIHHGIDVGDIPAGHGEGGYLAFLGRICPEKGVVEAIEVARRASVPLLIAAKCSQPAELDYFERVVRPRLGGTIEFVGELASFDKYRLLGGATALLSPIMWDEPFGLVMIEALSTGTPVLTTARGSAPEIVRDGTTGFVRADPGDLVELVGQAGALDRSACRDDACRRFSTDRMVRRHEALYERLLGGEVGRSRRHRATDDAEITDAVA
jgi:glycosyltransferase involved in cell wall biosynthesis